MSVEPLEPRRLLSAVLDVLGGDQALTLYAGQTVHVSAVRSDVSADGDGDPTTGDGDPLTARYEWDFGNPRDGISPSADPPQPPPNVATTTTTNPTTVTRTATPLTRVIRTEHTVTPVPRSVPISTPTSPVADPGFNTAEVLDGNYNRLVGFNAAHTYDRPGTYLLRLVVVDAADRRHEAERTVTVMPDTRTSIYVGSDGLPTNDGLTPHTPINVGELRRRLAGSAIGSDVRIRFRRGDVFELPTAEGGLDLRGRVNVTLESYLAETSPADAPKPLLYWTGAGNNKMIIAMTTAARHVVIRDLAFQTDATGFDRVNVPDAIQPRGTNITVRDCLFRNVNSAVMGNSSPSGVLVQNSVAPTVADIRGYFVWLGGTDMVLLGNTVLNSTREHAIRGANYARVLIAGNRVANVAVTDPYDSIKGALTLQAGSHVYAVGNAIDGFASAGPLGQADGKPHERLTWAVLEGNNVVNQPIVVRHGTLGAAVRNNVVRMQPTNQHEAIKVDGFVTVENNVEYRRGTRNVRVQFNTVTMGQSTGRGIWVLPGGTGHRLIGNLVTATRVDPRALVTDDDNLATDNSTLSTLFHELRDNLLPPGRSVRVGAGNGTNPVSLDAAGWADLKTRCGFTDPDVFRAVILDGRWVPDRAARTAKPSPGVWVDLYGHERPYLDFWTSGAVEAAW